MTIALPQYRTPTPWLETLVEEIMVQNSNGLLEQDLTRWREDLHARLQRVQEHPEQNMGFIEEHIRQSALELQRLLVQKAMQDKADAVDREMSPLPTSPLQQEAASAENRRRLLRQG